MTLLDTLARFNRKERFALVGWALGNKSFTLGDDFRAEVASAVGLADGIPAHAFVAMDYHLDWLYASLSTWQGSGSGPFPRQADCVTGSQQDIDLLIGFEARGATHLVLLEAKFDTAFTNEQLRQKAQRFKAIFGPVARAWPGVTPHFVLASPRESQGIDCTAWPSWMHDIGRPAWVQLAMANDLTAVTRCDQHGEPSSVGEFWRVVSSSRQPARVGTLWTAEVVGLDALYEVLDARTADDAPASIGFTGGTAALRQASLGYLHSRAFRLRPTGAPGGIARNWIPAATFRQVVSQLIDQPEPAAA